MVFDDHRNCVVLFGGITNAVIKGSEFRLADTWEWDGNLWVQRQNMGPQNRSNQALAYDSDRKRIVLFGGGNGITLFGDTWEFAEWPST